MDAFADRLRVAQAAARAGGATLMARWRQPLIDLQVKSAPGDLVSLADTEAELAIAAVIHEAFPDDALLGEEHGSTAGVSGVRWVVDPLDGTANFVRGLPCFAVSVACEDDAGGLVAAVYDPVADELFSARRGGPVLLNEAVAPPSPFRADSLSSAMVGGSVRGLGPQRAVKIDRGLAACGVNIGMGSAALMLAWASVGRMDVVHFEIRRLAEWDVAAGAMLCRQAGLVARWLPASEGGPEGRYIAGPVGIVDEFLALSS